MDHGKHAPRKNDKVNHPSHYTFGGIEVIDYIRDKYLNKYPDAASTAFSAAEEAAK